MKAMFFIFLFQQQVFHQFQQQIFHQHYQKNPEIVVEVSDILERKMTLNRFLKVGAVLIISSLSTVADKTIGDFFAKIKTPELDEVFNTLGDRIFITTFGGFIFVTGVVSGEERIRKYALDALVSAGITSLINQTTKFILGRGRPYYTTNPYDFKFFGSFEGDRRRSFFSGHTSASTSFYLNVSKIFGSKYYLLPIPIFVGIARIKSQNHWFSDVVAGFGVGYIISE